MNVYRLLRLATNRRMPGFVKLFGLWAMHVSGRRYIGVFFDPVLACNLQCRMCYFSDEARRASMKGVVSREQLDLLEKSLLPRTLKFQIGCGAEPSLYGGLDDLVARARRAGVPYVSLVSNGQLLVGGRIDLMRLVDEGLDELTLSMHGTQRDTYEYLMPGASFDRLLELTSLLGEIKRRHPGFKVRINFTVNSLNLHDLENEKFWRVWPEGVRPDIVQLRPVQDMGGKGWTDFDLQPIKDAYDDTIGNVVRQCHERGIMCIAPNASQIDEVVTEQDALSALIEDATYYYVSPGSVYRPDFDPATDTFDSYHRRCHTGRRLFYAIFTLGTRKGRSRNASKKLNYRVE